MSLIDLSETRGFLYLIADSHIGSPNAPAEELALALQKLPDAHCIVCLGDLFHIWLGEEKFWNASQRLLLETWKELTQRGIVTCFTVGNRDLLTSKFAIFAQAKYFTHITHHELQIRWATSFFGFTHGDEINQQDKQYLRWKKLIRHPLTEWLIRQIPTFYAQKLAMKGESTLAKTDQAFKICFPEQQCQSFADQLPDQFTTYFVGHFHQDRVVSNSQGIAKMRVVPDWLASKSVLAIAPDGRINKLVWKEQVWSSA